MLKEFDFHSFPGFLITTQAVAHALFSLKGFYGPNYHVGITEMLLFEEEEMPPGCLSHCKSAV